MTRVFLASRNSKKLEELRRILNSAVPGIEVLGLADVPSYDEPAETEPSFEGNALIKARAGLQATGLPSLADDSGLCVDALRGMPGVLSARWAGRAKVDAANNALLLEQLEDTPDVRRGAQFRCAVAFCAPGGVEEIALRGDARPGHPRAPWDGWFRLRRAVRTRRWQPHDGRASRRREGRDQPSWQGAPGDRAGGRPVGESRPGAVVALRYRAEGPVQQSRSSLARPRSGGYEGCYARP